MERTATRVRAAHAAPIMAAAFFFTFWGIPASQCPAAEVESSPGQNIARDLVVSAYPAAQAPTIGLQLVPDDKGGSDRLPAFSLSAPAYALAVRISKSGTCVFSLAQEPPAQEKPHEDGVAHPVPLCRDLPEGIAAEFAPPSLTLVFTASKRWEFPQIAPRARNGCVVIPPSDKETFAALKRLIKAMSRDEAFNYGVLEIPKPDRSGKIRTMDGAIFKGAPSRPGKGASRPEEVTGVQGLRPQDVPK